MARMYIKACVMAPTVDTCAPWTVVVASHILYKIESEFYVRMDKDKTRRRTGPHGGTVTGALALLLVICLAECASGSCLSYGHSCWGAHGKRSPKPPATAPDWFLTKLIRRIDANSDLNRVRQAAAKNDDIRALFQVEVPDDSPHADNLGSDSEDIPLEMAFNRNPEAKPMLDDDLLAKLKFWHIMREESDEK